jgi:hypothetical protein
LPAALALLTFAILAFRIKGEDRSVLPFAWILLVPAITVPLHVYLLGNITNGYTHRGWAIQQRAGECTEMPSGQYEVEWACPLDASLMTLSPGLLNLVPFLWALSGRRRVRQAAIVAGSLGLLRFVVPVGIYIADAPDVTIIGGYQGPPAIGSIVSGYTSLALYVVSVVISGAFLTRQVRSFIDPYE